jgi:hypothetical protein
MNGGLMPLNIIRKVPVQAKRRRDWSYQAGAYELGEIIFADPGGMNTISRLFSPRLTVVQCV